MNDDSGSMDGDDKCYNATTLVALFAFTALLSCIIGMLFATFSPQNRRQRRTGSDYGSGAAASIPIAIAYIDNAD